MKYQYIAAIAFTMLVACGGNEKILEASEAGDYDKVGKIEEEMDEWYDNLSETDQKKADDAIEKWGDQAMDRLIKEFDNL